MISNKKTQVNVMKTYLKKYARNLSTVIIVILFSTSLWQLASAGWIQGKAIIAQQLLYHAWKQSLNDSDDSLHHKPWPWADTWPVAKLSIPQHHIEQIILAGDGGNSLAFAPGYSFASATPNSGGTTVISAHRDTHFSFLKSLNKDDFIYIETADQTLSYQVYDIKIADSTDYVVPANSDEPTLVLVTCYPFNAISTGGSMRYLIFAALTADAELI